MPANIRIITGVGSGREHWIERAVTRIGSHPDCDLCLPSPDLAAHAVTIEFRNRAYVIHNRSERSIQVGQRSIEKQSQSVWAAGEKLVFPEVAELMLLVDRDPLPSPKPIVTETDPAPLEQSDEEEVQVQEQPSVAKGGLSPKEIVQLAITIACVLGIIAIIVYKMFPQDSREPSVRIVKLSEVLGDRIKNTTDKGYAAMVDEVQEASVLKSKGDIAEATKKLTRVRTQLHERRNATGDLATEHEKRLYDYVASQLSAK